MMADNIVDSQDFTCYSETLYTESLLGKRKSGTIN